MKLKNIDLKDKALTAVSKLKNNIKKTYYNYAEIPAVSVPQLADFIQNHPDTQVNTKHLLGNTYRFFKLKIHHDEFYLETIHNRILQLDYSSNQKKQVTYRSYRDSHKLNTPIKLA